MNPVMIFVAVLDDQSSLSLLYLLGFAMHCPVVSVQKRAVGTLANNNMQVSSSDQSALHVQVLYPCSAGFQIYFR